MSNDQFDELLKRMTKIAEAVNTFKSEQVQLLAFKMLLNGPDSVETESGDNENGSLGQQNSTTIKKQTAQKQPITKNVSKKARKIVLSIDKDLNLKPKGKKAIDDFITGKSPSSLLEKVAVCVYYLQRELNIKDIGYNHVFTCFKHLNWRLPSDLPNTMQQAGTKGWLDTSNSMDLKITTHGENLVEHDLPKNKG